MLTDQAILKNIASYVSGLRRPTPASSIQKGLRKAGISVTRSNMDQALQELANQRQIFQHPPSICRKNASPCYFGKSSAKHVEDLILGSFVSKTELPESALRKNVGRAYKDWFDEAVGNLINNRRLFDRRQGRTTYFAKEPPRTLAEVKESLLEATKSAKKPFTRTELKHILPGKDANLFERGLKELLAEKKLFERRIGQSRRLVNQPPRPSELLTKTQTNGLRKILDRINEHRQKPLTLDDLLAFLDGTLERQPEGLDHELSEELLVRWYTEDLPRRAGLRSIPIPWTWRRYEQWCRDRGERPNVALFHDLLSRMSNRSEVGLTSHNNPDTIPQSELDVLRRDEDGRVTYYWMVLK